MSETAFLVNTVDRQLKAVRTCHVMTTPPERIHQRCRISALRINKHGVQLIMQTTELYALTDVHSPIQVEDPLKHGREDS
jgi:hypothetical protein